MLMVFFEYAPDSSTKINLYSSYSDQHTQTLSPDTIAIQTLKTAGNSLISQGKTEKQFEWHRRQHQ